MCGLRAKFALIQKSLQVMPYFRVGLRDADWKALIRQFRCEMHAFQRDKSSLLYHAASTQRP